MAKAKSGGKNHYTIAYPVSLQGDGLKNISIGSSTQILSHCMLGSWVHWAGFEYYPSIEIGNNCIIGEYTHITSINKIVIGNGVLTGRYVVISDNAHGTLSLEEAAIRPSHRKLISKGEVVIGNNVWIGDKATILAGVHIGDNVIVAANAVVTTNVPSNSIVAGVSAKKVKSL